MPATHQEIAAVRNAVMSILTARYGSDNVDYIDDGGGIDTEYIAVATLDGSLVWLRVSGEPIPQGTHLGDRGDTE